MFIYDLWDLTLVGMMIIILPQASWPIKAHFISRFKRFTFPLRLKFAGVGWGGRGELSLWSYETWSKSPGSRGFISRPSKHLQVVNITQCVCGLNTGVLSSSHEFIWDLCCHFNDYFCLYVCIILLYCFFFSFILLNQNGYLFKICQNAALHVRML